MGSDISLLLFFFGLLPDISIIHKLLLWNEYGWYVFSDESDIYSIREQKGLRCTDESFVFCDAVIVMRSSLSFKACNRRWQVFLR